VNDDTLLLLGGIGLGIVAFVMMRNDGEMISGLDGLNGAGAAGPGDRIGPSLGDPRDIIGATLKKGPQAGLAKAGEYAANAVIGKLDRGVFTGHNVEKIGAVVKRKKKGKKFLGINWGGLF
jgi:hypothetical protein